MVTRLKYDQHKHKNIVRNYYIRVSKGDLPTFCDFCARTKLEEHHHSTGFVTKHADTILFTLTMTESDRTAMALAVPVSIMLDPNSERNIERSVRQPVGA